MERTTFFFFPVGKWPGGDKFVTSLSTVFEVSSTKAAQKVSLCFLEELSDRVAP